MASEREGRGGEGRGGEGNGMEWSENLKRGNASSEHRVT